VKALLRVFKIGGQVVENEGALRAFLTDFAAVEGHKILVHGGGRWVSEMSARLGLEVKMLDGRRITDSETLRVVQMMLAGVANKTIVSILQGFQCNALGLTGADGDAIRAVKRPVRKGLDYGFVGDVVAVNTSLISRLIGEGVVPVFAPMTHNGAGQMLNTNADTVASSLATGMAGDYNVELVYCFEYDGVLEDVSEPGSVIESINREGYGQLVDQGIIVKGMLPKIDNAFDALEQGVRLVKICNAAHIGNFRRSEPFGTNIVL
jgi:acetylglutamate kinase